MFSNWSSLTNLLAFFKLKLKKMYMGVLPPLCCVPRVPDTHGDERTWDSLELELYRWLWATVWVLGIEPGSSGGAM